MEATSTPPLDSTAAADLPQNSDQASVESPTLAKLSLDDGTSNGTNGIKAGHAEEPADHIADNVSSAAVSSAPHPRQSAQVFVVGSANLDEVYTVPGIVRPRETIAAMTYSRHAGGKGANQAIGASRAGAAVKFVGAIGQDGHELHRVFEADGIQLDYLHISSELPTGRAVIQVAPDGENAIVISPGANFVADLPLPPFRQAKVVLLQNEIPLERTIAVIKEANQAGAVVIFNPSPLPSREQRSYIPWDLIDYLVVNEAEAPALGFHLCQRPGALITTFGKRGSQLKLRASDETTYRPAGAVAKSGAVDTTGAGDCFTAYLAALLLKLPNARTPSSQERAELLTIANQAAAMSVEKKGALYGVPLLYQVRDRMAAAGYDWPTWAS